MDAVISDALKEQIMQSLKWIQDLNYHAMDDSTPVNLAKAVSPLPQILMNANDQPENHLFFNVFFCFHQISMDWKLHLK